MCTGWSHQQRTRQPTVAATLVTTVVDYLKEKNTYERDVQSEWLQIEKDQLAFKRKELKAKQEMHKLDVESNKQEITGNRMQSHAGRRRRRRKLLTMMKAMTEKMK